MADVSELELDMLRGEVREEIRSLRATTSTITSDPAADTIAAKVDEVIRTWAAGRGIETTEAISE